jgi:hypothetical protein
MKVSLIYPSRSRPDQCRATLQNWISKAGSNDLEIILSLDEDDIRLSEYQKMIFDGLTSNWDEPPLTYTVLPNKSTVEAVNAAARISQGEILIVVSDDFDCPEGWFDTIIKAIGTKNDFVLKVFDGLQERIITLPIMDRAYYSRFEYIYHPDYKHLWADTEFSEVAYKLNKVIVRNDIVFTHNHYSILKTHPDATYLKNELTYEEGKQIFKHRQKQRFGLGNYAVK